MKDARFTHIFNCLAHPITISAILLLLFNDHVLKQLFHSWLTGKLSDFAWLVFGPLLVAVPLALIFPNKYVRQSALVGGLACLFVGLLFTLAKTNPYFNELTTHVASLLNEVPVTIQRDPSDLIALPALLVSWSIWKGEARRPHVPPRHAYILLAVGVLATVASTTPGPNRGIMCLGAKQDTVYTFADLEKIFVSRDAGLTWQSAPYPDDAQFVRCDGGGLDVENFHQEWQLADPTSPLVHYRFRQGVAIDRSDDGGQTWKLEVDLTPYSYQARLSYLEKILASDTERVRRPILALPGPLDAIISLPTHNVIVAMSQDGLLVRTSDGKWQWVTVGPYHLQVYDKAIIQPAPNRLSTMLILLPLVLATIFNFLKSQVGIPFIVISFVWAGWLFLAGGLYSVFTDRLFLLVMFLIAICLAAEPFVASRYLVEMKSRKSLALAILIILLSTLILAILPYTLWLRDVITDDFTVAAITVTLLAVDLVCGFMLLRNRVRFHRRVVSNQPDSQNSKFPAEQ